MKTRTFHVLARNGRYYVGTLSSTDGWTDRWVDGQDTARLFDLTDKGEAHDAESAVEAMGGRLFPVEVDAN